MADSSESNPVMKEEEKIPRKFPYLQTSALTTTG
jgi:hypothetical protein